MAYATGSATDIEDLVSELDTFLTANGFTQDQLDTGNNYASWHETGGSLYFSVRWDSSPGEDLGIYQALGFAGAGAPHTQTDDSGQGATGLPLSSFRSVNLESSGPYTAYHFFTNASGDYIHVAIEVDSGRFRHFGFGTLEKANDFTGGEYAYGHNWNQGTSQIDDPRNISNYFCLDMGASAVQAGSLHVEGLPGMGGSEKWAVVFGGTPSTAGTDRAGENRVVAIGTARGGLWTHSLAWIRGSVLNVYIPLIPIEVMYRDTSTSPDTAYLLGRAPDLAIVNMNNFNNGDEISVGSDTWKIFSWVKKQFLQANTEESWNAGIAYKKIS